MSAKRPHQMRISHPMAAGPDEETRVPCPGCGSGMVTPTRAAKIAEAVKGEPPPPPPLPETLPALPEIEPVPRDRACFVCGAYTTTEYCSRACAKKAGRH